MTEYIASFDIGKKNFAFCIEKIDKKLCKQIQNLPVSNRYYKNGTPTPAFQEVLDKLYHVGTVELLGVIDLTKNCNPKAYLDPQTYLNMIEELDKYKKYWAKCSTFIIEKQMSFRAKYNTMALKLGQHCYTYFLMNYKDKKTIVEYPAYHKTQVLGALKSEVKQKPKRKKWAIKKALEILETRDDQFTIEGVSGCKKKDDMADCLLMTITYTFLHFI